MVMAKWREGLIGCVLALVAAAGADAQPVPPGIQIPSIAPSVQVRTLEVRDITLGSPDTATVEIGRITFRGFARGAASVRAETVEFEAVIAKFGARKLEIPEIRISGFEVPAALFQALSEGGGADLDWPALLLKSSAADLVIDTARDSFEKSPLVTVTYAGLALKNFRNGLLESAKLDRTSGQTNDQNSADQLTFNIGAIGYHGVDIAELVRFVSGGGSGGAKPLIERSVANEIEVTFNEGRLAIKKIELIGFDGRAPTTSFARQQVPAGPPQIVLPGVTPERAIERSYYGGLVDLALDAAVAGSLFDLAPDKLGGATPRTGLVRLTGLVVDTPIGPVSLGDMRVGVDNPDVPVPGLVSFAFDRARVDLSRLEPNQGGDKLKAYGYDELAADLLIQIRLSAGERALVVENSALLIDRVGRLDLGIRLGNFDVNAAANDAEIAEREIQKAHIEHVSLRLTNLGFAERFFSEIGRNLKPSPESPRAQLAVELRRQAVELFGKLLAPGAAEAIEAFVRSPGRIAARAELRPGQPPLTVSQIQALGPAELAERVVIKVEIPKD